MLEPRRQVLNLISRRKAVKLTTLHQHFPGVRVDRILRELTAEGKIRIQQSGFVGDNAHHGKLVVRVNQQIPLTTCPTVHQS